MTHALAKHLCTPLLLFGMFTGLYAAEARAQQPTRSGFWLEAGTGTGGVWVGCTGCGEATAAFGGSGYLRGGGAFSDRVLWGLEVFSLLNEFDEADMAQPDSTFEADNRSFGPVVLWYPWRNGVFIKGGVGLSYNEIRLRGPGGGAAVLNRSVGSGLSFGVGLDVPVLSRLALTVSFGAYFGAVGDIAVRDTYVDDVITTMYNANVALTIR